MRVYGNIKTESELKNLQASAPTGVTAVGVTDGGNLFIMGKGGSASPITPNVAKDILQLTPEEIGLLISSRGKCQFVDPVVEEPSLDAMIENMPAEVHNDPVPVPAVMITEAEEVVVTVDELEPDFTEPAYEEVNFDEPEEDEDFVTISKEEYDILIEKSTSYDAIKDLIINSKY
jgi:hypothetical protein